MSFFNKYQNKKPGSVSDSRFHNLHLSVALLDEEERIAEVNPSFCELSGYNLSHLLKLKISEILSTAAVSENPVDSWQQDFSAELLLNCADNSRLPVHAVNSCFPSDSPLSGYSQLELYRLNQPLDPKTDSANFEWLNQHHKIPVYKDIGYIPFYGDLTELNTDRLILDNVGKENLVNICRDIIELMNTSLAIYEKNGDYAFGMFNSGWCRVMDAASRLLCGDVDNRTAITCGKWLCHEVCWNQSAKAAINSASSTDIKCPGGLRLYAEPIFMGEQVIGAINIAYGNPPQEINEQIKLAELYDIELAVLQQAARDYQPRPSFIIENAKMRLHGIALLIGKIVEQNLSKIELKRSQDSFQLLADVTFEGIIIHKNGIIIDVNESFCKITGFSKKEALNANLLDFIPAEEDVKIVKANLLKSQPEPYVVSARKKDGSTFKAELEARNLRIQGELIRIVAFKDVTKKLEIESNLKESNEQFTALVNQAPESLFFHDSNGDILEVNRATETKYGYSRKELLSMNVKDFDPDFVERNDIDTIWTQIEKDKPVIFQGRHRRKNGSTFPVEISLGKIFLPDSTHYIALARDITDRLEAEKTIHANQERYQTLLENIPSPVFIHDGNGKIISANSAAQEAYGYSFNELVGLYPQDIEVEQDNSEIKNTLSRFPQDKKIVFQTKHKRKDGSTFPVDYHGHYFLFKGKPLIVSICIDITERLQAARALKESEKMFRLLAENSVDCIWQMTPRLKFTYLSPSLKMMTGFEPDEWIGTHLWEHTTKLEFFKMARLALKMLKHYLSFKYVTFETKMFNKAGQLLPLEINSKPMIQDGKLIGLQGSTRLISERKKQEEELNKYRQNLENMVEDRTAQLEKLNNELIHYNKLFVGREFRIKELREEVKQLKEELSKCK